MSPGPSFERVYTELKRQLRAGTRPPGTPLEPTAIGDELGTSFTPVRDALHRLVGEGLVENPKHNGFSVPHPTEQALRDLYNWNGEVVAVVTSRIRPDAGALLSAAESDDPELSASGFFTALAAASGNREHIRTIQQLNDRLAPYRHTEAAILSDLDQEVRAIIEMGAKQNRAGLVRALSRYHKRRISIVPEILAALAPS